MCVCVSSSFTTSCKIICIRHKCFDLNVILSFDFTILLLVSISFQGTVFGAIFKRQGLSMWILLKTNSDVNDDTAWFMVFYM